MTSSNASGQPLPLRLLGRLCRLAEWLAIVMLLVTAALVLAQVIGRNLFHTGLPVADELARYSGLGMIYLTVPLLLLQNKHITVDIFIAKLGPRARRVMDIINEALVLLFCVLFLWGGWLFLKRAGRFATPALGMPNTWFYLPALTGLALLTLVALYRAVALLTGQRPEGDAAP